MKQILVISQDKQFIARCREHLAPILTAIEGATGDQGSIPLPGAAADVAILHAQPASGDWYAVFRMLREARPEIKIIVVSEIDGYWSDFRYWMADDCIFSLHGGDDMISRLSAALSRCA